MTLAKVVKDDIQKQLKGVYSTGSRSRQVQIHELPDLIYLVATLRGKYDIRKMHYKNMFKCLNRVKTYTTKNLNKNFIISPIEYECEDRTSDEAAIALMICVPKYIDESLIHQAMMDNIGHIDESISIKTVPGGMFAQILHEGRYDDIFQSKALLDETIFVRGYVTKGVHTEINMAPMFPNNECKIIIRQRIEAV